METEEEKEIKVKDKDKFNKLFGGYKLHASYQKGVVNLEMELEKVEVEKE